MPMLLLLSLVALVFTSMLRYKKLKLESCLEPYQSNA